MTDLERIAAEMRAAIGRLRAREASLTPIERLKLASLLLNLQRVLAAIASGETCRGAGSSAEVPCSCAQCDLP